MRSTFQTRRHPVAGCAVLLAALLAAGCGQDGGTLTSYNPPPTQVYARGPVDAQGQGDSRQPGFALGRVEAAHPESPARSTGERNSGRLDELMAWERQDMGVRPTRELHSGTMHGPTPNQIPGGQVITTKGLLPLLQQGIPVYVFDVLGGSQSLPNAIPAAQAATPGSFEDETQQGFGQMLQQVTRGNSDAPLVFYCQGPQCWMSYNAALRAIALGYRNVLWYRGGMEAWGHAGLRFASAPGQG